MGRVRQFRSVFGIDELSATSTLWKSMIAEYIGTAILVFIACGTCTNWGKPGEPSITQIALSFAFIVATMAQALGHVSGAHINPAVTMGMLCVGHVSILRAFFYICSQLIGGITGAAILRAVTPEDQQGILGGTKLADGVTPFQGVVVELMITFILVLTVFAVCDQNRLDILGSPPLAIGLSVGACHLMAIGYTGASMNTARTFGPAVISGVFDDHWVYWLGPIGGGVLAGFVYQYVLSAPAITSEALDKAQLASLAKFHNKEVVEDRTTSI
ncbi:aquaporin AQPAe.a-like [Ornithodoros turicata]|uniref:aquaporin AQPAe.a-like n=1 Tax=Ornithodoros turicata TaxID=34597 RepID=UPI003139A0B5